MFTHQPDEAPFAQIVLNQRQWQQPHAKSGEYDFTVECGVVRGNFVPQRNDQRCPIRAERHDRLVLVRRYGDEDMVGQIGRVTRALTRLQVVRCRHDGQRQAMQQPRHSQVGGQHERQYQADVVALGCQIDRALHQGHLNHDVRVLTLERRHQRRKPP